MLNQLKSVRKFYTTLLIILGIICLGVRQTLLLADEPNSNYQNKEVKEKSKSFRVGSNLKQLLKKYPIAAISSVLVVGGIIIGIHHHKNRNSIKLSDKNKAESKNSHVQNPINTPLSSNNTPNQINTQKSALAANQSLNLVDNNLIKTGNNKQTNIINQNSLTNNTTPKFINNQNKNQIAQQNTTSTDNIKEVGQVINSEKKENISEKSIIQANQKKIKEAQKELDKEKEAIALYEIAQLYKQEKEYKNALLHYQKAGNIYLDDINKARKNHKNYAKVLYQIARIYQEQGDNKKAKNYDKEALNYYQEALKICKDKFTENSEEYGDLLYELASAYEEINRFEEAEKHYHGALNSYIRGTNEKHEKYINTRYSIGTMQEHRGKYKEALRHYTAILHSYRKKSYQNNKEYGNILSAIGNTYYYQNNHTQAFEPYAQALIIYANTIGQDHNTHVRLRNRIVKVYEKLLKGLSKNSNQKINFIENPYILSQIAYYYAFQQYDKAINLYNQVLKIYKATVGPKDSKYIKTLEKIKEIEQKKKY